MSSVDALQQIARTLLYEGYVLWPYRRSATKNQQRWTFGGVYPKAYANISGGADRWQVRTECLLERNGDHVPSASISVRFLQVVARQAIRVDRRDGSTIDTPVDELTVAGQRYLTWDEAVERTIEVPVAALQPELEVRIPIEIAAGSLRESLQNRAATASAEEGAIIRSWQELRGSVLVRVTQSDSNTELFRVGVTVTNESNWTGHQREDAVRHTLISAHVVLHASNALLVSQFDPPAEFKTASDENLNEGLWPILVGDDGARHTMLASPIILYDYPRLAPESPGDLFDGGEIDQLLILNILTLTEEEQREMRDSDPRAREILERCQGLSEEELMRLHGTVRALRPVPDSMSATA